MHRVSANNSLIAGKLLQMAEIAVLQEFFIYFDQGVKRSEFPLQANLSNLALQYLEKICSAMKMDPLTP